ncbi:DUF2274 domain-containing protein [Sphingomonas sp.]|uniref:DUF2274 domain-containing protein n=1 Tax=Sphingomonas sp. TaxID=28214 RepID=UPI0039C9145D
MDLKLARLPERTPVKIAISVSPDLAAALADYAAIYEKTYGHSEPVAELIPAMLSTFLESDRAFAKARKGLGTDRAG